jgi:hypothetical protein
MTIFVSSCRNKLTKKYAKKNGTPCICKDSYRILIIFFITHNNKIQFKVLDLRDLNNNDNDKKNFFDVWLDVYF